MSQRVSRFAPAQAALVVLTVIFGLVAPASAVAPGSIDTSFGEGGILKDQTSYVSGMPSPVCADVGTSETILAIDLLS